MNESGNPQDADRVRRSSELRLLAVAAAAVVGLESTLFGAAGGAWFTPVALVGTAAAVVLGVWSLADVLIARSSARERVRGSGGMTPMTQVHWRHRS